MNFGFTLFVAIAPVAAIIMILSIILILPYRKEPAAQALLWFLFFVCWLLLTNTAELIAPVGFYTLTFAKLEYLSYVYIPVVWLSFCLRYTGWITYTNKKVLLAAIGIPALLFCLVLTNDIHHLLWSHIAYIESQSFSVLKPQYGPLYWILFASSWSLTIFGTIIIISSHLTGHKLYHSQSLWILAGAILPGLANIINLSRIIPGLNKDFTPIAYALSAGCFLAGMYFHRLFWVMPIARGVIFQNLDIGILVLDPQGWIIDHNQKFDTLFNLPNICIGISYTENLPLRQLLTEAKYSTGKEFDSTKNGQFKWNESTYSYSIQPVNQWSKGIILTVADISWQVQIQADMTRIKEEFIHREKLASVGQLTAGLAHEVSSPLSYLKNDIRSLEHTIKNIFKNTDNPEQKEIINLTKGISEGLERIENVIRTLLSFSRQGRAEPAYEEYNLRSGIDTTLEIMQGELQDVAEVVKVYGETPIIQAQKDEINQVLFNILSNALQAIKERIAIENINGRITIRTGMSDSKVFCEIENNGTPITPEIRVRLFELFFTTKPENWGTGLGLNISKEIIEQRHHGNLFLVSIDPVIFRFELPYYTVS